MFPMKKLFAVSLLLPAAMTFTADASAPAQAQKHPFRAIQGAIQARLFEPDDAPVPGNDEGEISPENFEAIRQAAEQGDPDAQFQLGHAYENGIVVEANPERAVRWYLKAAEQGNAMAQYGLGYACQNGLGTGRDDGAALEWFRQAAAQGLPEAMNAIGVVYNRGAGVPQNPIEAMRWYRKAADAGNPAAQYNTGIMYSQGEGVEQDQEEAVKWFAMAAENGDSNAMTALASAYRDGDGIEQDLSQAFAWYHRAAQEGNSFAQNSLGALYMDGLGVEADYGEAMIWFHAAAQQGNSDALFNIGTMYEDGQGVEQDFREAIKWYREAAEEGDEDAAAKIRELGGKLEQGGRIPDNGVDGEGGGDGEAANDVSRDGFNPGTFAVFEDPVLEGSVEELRKAADRGDARALHALGLHYLKSPGVDRSSRKAVELFRKAADAGSLAAKTELAKCYAFEYGVFLDYDKAIRLAEEAAAEEYPPAIAFLGDRRFVGRGMALDMAKAFELAKDAAERGSVDGLATLGGVYALDSGPVEKDEEFSRLLLHFTAEHGVLDSQLVLSFHYGVAGPGQSDEDLDEDLADKWRQAAADQGDLSSLFMVAQKRAEERVRRKKADLTDNYATYQAKADGGDREAFLKLGDCYWHGFGVSQDAEEALEYYTLAAEENVPEGETRLGDLYQAFLLPGGAKNPYFNTPKAISHYEKADAAGSLRGTAMLALLYNDSKEVRYKGKAEALVKKAAEGGDAAGQGLLALMYFRGEGIERNGTLGAVWLGKMLRNEEFEKDFGMYSFIGMRWEIISNQEKASRGDKDAILALAFTHLMGFGRDQDGDIAMQWYRKGAELGDARAQYALGAALTPGEGVEQNVPEGMKNLKLAADQGFVQAQLAYGSVNILGEPHGIPRDCDAAVKYLTLAAEQNNAEAQAVLGGILKRGDCGDRDFAGAEKWFKRAAEQDLPEAMLELGRMYSDGIGVAPDYDQALALFKKAFFNYREPRAAVELGKMYLYGRGEYNLSEAAGYFMRAADYGIQDGSLYFLHMVLDRDPLLKSLDGKEAMERLQENADKGSPLAQYLLSQYYREGQIDRVKEKEWLDKAAENGNVDAMRTVGMLYAHGKDGKTEENIAESRKWYLKAAEYGDRGAMYLLGENYLFGRDGWRIDVDQGLKWLEAGARLEHPTAMRSLITFYSDKDNPRADEAKAAQWQKRLDEVEAGIK